MMERDAAKARGTALREYVQARLPVAGAQTITSLARKAGVRPNTMTSWWTKGTVPDNATLELLAGALGVGLADLVAAYQGSSGRNWVLTDTELEALLDRAAERGAERAVRWVLAERERDEGG